jgi:SAM-dependent methyltransferase
MHLSQEGCWELYLYGHAGSDDSMPDTRDRPEVHQAYKRLAAGYDRKGDTQPANAYLERPATLSLLPDVTEARILDAGCGAGHLARELADRDAGVVGLDASREMLTYARTRAPDADFLQADLGGDFPFDADVFDGVASSLAFHYVREWERLFRKLRRILRPGGWVVFSVQIRTPTLRSTTTHKTTTRESESPRYGIRSETKWRFQRTADPLSAMVTPALNAGFRLDRLIEPTPTAE